MNLYSSLYLKRPIEAATRVVRLAYPQWVWHVFCLFFLGLGFMRLALADDAAKPSLSVLVQDAANSPLDNAVVYAEPLVKLSTPHASAMIEQRGRQFNPLVSVVQVGTEVLFPNFDSVRHHVYSFSPAKNFELKLYSGVPASPVVFDKAGTVVLGCNIHDYMVAFIHVVDTPYFAKTDKSGKAILNHLPKGDYTLKVWHYALAKEKDLFTQPLVLNGNQALTATLVTKPFLLPARK